MSKSTPWLKQISRDGSPESENWSFAELCRRRGISRQTGYKWLARYQQEGADGLRDIPASVPPPSATSARIWLGCSSGARDRATDLPVFHKELTVRCTSWPTTVCA